MAKLKQWILVLLAAVSVAVNAQIPINERFAETPIRIIDDVNGVSMVLAVDDLFYSPVNPIIRASYFQYLNSVADAVNEYPNVNIIITGHTDQVMTREQRNHFSEKYAYEVAQYLLVRGVNPNRIVRIEGDSSYLAVDDPWTMDGRNLNRRVEVTLAGDSEVWDQNCDHCMQIPRLEGEIE